MIRNKLALRLMDGATWLMPVERRTWVAAMRAELDHLPPEARLAFAAGCIGMAVCQRVQRLAANRWRVLRLLVAAFVLIAPAVAMRLTSQVVWTGFDFAAMGLLLGLGLGGYEILAASARSSPGRIGGAVAVLAACLAVWIELAVGIVGDGGGIPGFAQVALVAAVMVGAVWTRGRPAAMRRLMFAATAGQMGIALLAVVLAPGAAAAWPFDTLGVSALLCGAWLVAAKLFVLAERGSPA